MSLPPMLDPLLWYQLDHLLAVVLASMPTLLEELSFWKQEGAAVVVWAATTDQEV